MLTYPQFDPIAIRLGPLAIHWYGIMYIVGFTAAWLLANYRAKRLNDWDKEQVADLIFYGALGVVIGGRIGYMLFYAMPVLLHNPIRLLYIWEGGMSFHGGLLGVMIAMYFFARQTGRTYFTVTDFVAPLVPIGLGLGRIGNFINGELWGRVTTVSWGMVFPNGGDVARHPSQLYEFLLEGVLFFILLWWYSAKPRPAKAVSAIFLILYGCLRIIAELFREPDPQYGFLLWNWLTMGQLLSLPMLLGGIALGYYVYKENK